MSKKIFFIIIAVILSILLLFMVGYYFNLQDRTENPDSEPGGLFGLFPFGNGGDNSGENNFPIQENPGEVIDPSVVEKKLRNISADPVSGAGVFDTRQGSVIRFIDKGTGHIFETELFSPKQNRISNITMPLSYNAFWGTASSSVITQYLNDDNKTVETFALSIKNATSSDNEVVATPLPTNTYDISIFGNSVFMLQKNTNTSMGYITSFSGESRRLIWNSPITEISSQYINDRYVSITTKPAQGVSGFMYLVDTRNGNSTKTLGDIPGLSTITNSDASSVAYIAQTEGVSFFVFNPSNKLLKQLSPTTFPEKCVWSKKDKNIMYCAVPREDLDGESLSSWHKGFRSFSDDIWKYNTADGTSEQILDFYGEANSYADMTKLSLSPNEQYLVFVNKIDESLWSLDLTK